MPTYEYRCRDCGEELEIVQSFDDDALTVCPRCQGSLRKVFGSIGISFKGDGFYKTDSRTAATAATKADGEASDKPASKDTAKESKSDAATSDSSSKKDASSGGSSSGGGSSGGSSSDGGSSDGGSSDGGSGGSKSTATADSST